MLRTQKVLWALILLLPIVSIDALGNYPDVDSDDYIPEQNARVARIKFLEGEAQIKRAGNDKWELATQNLPIIEGDELLTDKATKLEIQFDKNNYLRLAPNSYLKIINLQKEGIAVSLSEGTLNLNILEFDKDKGYFEVDAPKTTFTVQKEGKYRIDAGDKYNKEVRIIVSDWGKARVYSDDSGFTLKNGQTARLFLEGDFAGEWETSRSSSFGDDFDKWTAERDSIVEKNLRNSNYDKYYDDSIYGADDLSNYGEWIYARNYGYVWRPYLSSISMYDDWAPYRYGHWRWLPSYGWTWINDEPWGWATYHYGRWFIVNNQWVWSPYSRHHRRRSFWRPAIVFITQIGINICWYPLPYDYGYYDYNRRYRRNWRRDRRNDRNGRGDRNDRGDTPTTRTVPAENAARARRNRTPSLRRLPGGGVTSTPASEFGRKRRGFRKPPLSVTRKVLKQTPDIIDSPPLLPTYKDLNGRVSKAIIIQNPRRTAIRRNVKIGATDRKAGTPSDKKLRRKTIYGNRTPQIIDRKSNDTSVESKRRTGVFDRTKRRTENSETTKREANPTPRSNFPNVTPRRSTPRTETRKERSSPPPVYKPTPRRTRPKSTPPPPVRREPKRSSPPLQKQRSEPKPKPSKSRSKSKDNFK